MQRRILLSAGIAILGLAFCFSQDNGESNKKDRSGIETLQEERIALLEKRYEQFSSYAQVELIDRAATIQPHLDLLQAKIDYEKNVEKRRPLYDKMLVEYDRLIELAKHEAHAPTRPAQPGLRASPRLTGAKVLWLQSEKIRIQIERDSLSL